MIIWLASYPRSGNTLLRIVLKRVFGRQTYSKHDDTGDIGADARTAEEVGHLTLGATWDEAYQRMRSAGELYLVKTHDGPEDGSKAIYIVRDGRSTCRSFYHYLKDYPFLNMEYTVRDVVAGFTSFGSWGDHLERWRPLDRPDTLFIKYEDLLSDAATQIQRIADFTGLAPVAEWHNDFDELHELNPRFFRAGSANDPASALDAEDNDIFWAAHGDWMRRLGYPEPRTPVGESGSVYRHFISERGKEQFFLHERLHYVGREVGHLRATLAVERDSQARTASELTGAAARVKELEAVLDGVRQELAQLRSAHDEHVRQAEQVQAQLRSALDEHVRRAEEVQAQLGEARGNLGHERTKTADLQRLLDEAGNLAEHARSEHATAMARSEKTIEGLRVVAEKLERRQQLLMSSRLIRLGWRVGLGSAPYWVDASRDDVLQALKTLRRDGTSPQSPDALNRLAEIGKEGPPKETDMDRALQHLLEKGFRPKVVLDVGAAKGYWTLSTAWRWKDAEFFMIDPLVESEPALQKICEDPRFHYVLTAVGNEPGELTMNMTPDCDGSSLLAFPNPNPAAQRRIPVVTIDDLMSRGTLKPPDMVKVDVQGFELNALDGARRVFDTAEVMIVEVNLFSFMVNCPRVHDVVKYMADRKFYLFDVAGLLRRPYEDDLGQMDLVFVSERSPMVASNRWG